MALVATAILASPPILRDSARMDGALVNTNVALQAVARYGAMNRDHAATCLALRALLETSFVAFVSVRRCPLCAGHGFHVSRQGWWQCGGCSGLGFVVLGRRI